MADKKIDDSGKALEDGVVAMGKGARGFNEEFLAFLENYNVIGLAVAVVIGAAATKMVNSTVNDIIMPIVGAFVPGGDLKGEILQIGPIKFMLGNFISSVIDFLIIALLIFILVKYVMKGDTSKKV